MKNSIQKKLLSLNEYELFIGYQFKDIKYLQEALTHKSYSNEHNSGEMGNNERLELLGDAVLGFIVTDLLLKKFHGTNEGVLSKYRSDIVNENRLAEIARSIDLGSQLKLGKGEFESGGSDKDSILSSGLEALLAAIYYDGGFEASYFIISKLFASIFDEIGKEDFSRDYKTRIQQYSQEHFKTKPLYRVTKENGPDHDKVFDVELSLENNLIATGRGNSKKQAEQDAARNLLNKLQEKK